MLTWTTLFYFLPNNLSVKHSLLILFMPNTTLTNPCLDSCTSVVPKQGVESTEESQTCLEKCEFERKFIFKVFVKMYLIKSICSLYCFSGPGIFFTLIYWKETQTSAILQLIQNYKNIVNLTFFSSTYMRLRWQHWSSEIVWHPSVSTGVQRHSCVQEVYNGSTSLA